MSRWSLLFCLCLGLFCRLTWAQSSIAIDKDFICQLTQIRATRGAIGAGMGHAYNELIFQNTGSNACRLDSDNVLLQRMDGADERSERLRRGNMPTEVHRNVAVNMDGIGSPQIKLGPQQRTAITTDWANRTGYTEADLCATKIRLRLAQQPGILWM